MSNGFPPLFLFIWQKNGESAGKDKSVILHTCDWMWACNDQRQLKWSCYGNLYCCCHWWSIWQVSLPNMNFNMLLAQGLWVSIYWLFCDGAFTKNRWHLKIQSFLPILQIVGKIHVIVLLSADQGSKSTFLHLCIAAMSFFFFTGSEFFRKKLSQVSISKSPYLAADCAVIHFKEHLNCYPNWDCTGSSIEILSLILPLIRDLIFLSYKGSGSNASSLQNVSLKLRTRWKKALLHEHSILRNE